MRLRVRLLWVDDELHPGLPGDFLVDQLQAVLLQVLA